MAPSIQPDIVLLDSQWPRRALLRAQLVEEGYEVVATDDWLTAKSYVQALLKPRLLIVDLQGLANASHVLDELQATIRADRVLILTALGEISADQLRKSGFQTLHRPAEVRDVVRKVSELLPRVQLNRPRPWENG